MIYDFGEAQINCVFETMSPLRVKSLINYSNGVNFDVVHNNLIVEINVNSLNLL